VDSTGIIPSSLLDISTWWIHLTDVPTFSNISLFKQLLRPLYCLWGVCLLLTVHPVSTGLILMGSHPSRQPCMWRELYRGSPHTKLLSIICCLLMKNLVLAACSLWKCLMQPPHLASSVRVTLWKYHTFHNKDTPEGQADRMQHTNAMFILSLQHNIGKYMKGLLPDTVVILRDQAEENCCTGCNYIVGTDEQIWTHSVI